MALRRFWIDPEFINQNQLIVKDDLFHHIRDVCRMLTGDRFEVLPGDGRAHLAEITKINKKDLQANLLESRPLETLRRPWIHLALSVPKFPKVDFILEKSVELGVHSLSLFVSEFSSIRQVGDISPSRLGRWEKINRAAAQQSGRGQLLNIEPPADLRTVLERFKARPGAVGLFPYEGEASLGWKQGLLAAKESCPDEVFVFVGSEGGFSPKEVELFQDFNLSPMTLGQQILRVETACVALVSVIKYEFEV